MLADLQGFLSSNSNKKIVVTTHREADLDAIASSFAISSLLKFSKLALLDEPNEEAKLLIKKLGIKFNYLDELKRSDFEGLIVTDCSSSIILPGIEEWKLIGIIDHHRKSGKNISADFELIEEECPSASELIAKNIDHSKLQKKVAHALAVGIISDTYQFSSSRLETFETLVKLMKVCGTDYSELLYDAFPPKPLDVKLSIIDAIKNTNFITYKNIIISTTEVDEKESGIAGLLSRIVDVSFVARADIEDSNYSKISLRISKTFDIKANEVMKEAGEVMNGKGGGHFKAAGGRVMANKKDALKKCVEILIKHIKSG